MFSLHCCLHYATSSPSTELRRQWRKSLLAEATRRVTARANGSVMVRSVVLIQPIRGGPICDQKAGRTIYVYIKSLSQPAQIIIIIIIIVIIFVIIFVII